MATTNTEMALHQLVKQKQNNVAKVTSRPRCWGSKRKLVHLNAEKLERKHHAQFLKYSSAIKWSYLSRDASI